MFWNMKSRPWGEEYGIWRPECLKGQSKEVAEGGVSPWRSSWGLGLCKYILNEMRKISKRKSEVKEEKTTQRPMSHN